jgi:hypothetical protein
MAEGKAARVRRLGRESGVRGAARNTKTGSEL